MLRFHGKYTYSIDSKGRVSIPSKFRSALHPDAHDTFIICQGPNGCLRAYPHNVWEIQEKKLLSRHETQQTLHHRRLLYNNLTDSTLDTQGRITLSQSQKDIAGITKEATLVGQADYVEIWNVARYESYLKEIQENFDQMSFQSVETEIANK